MLGFNDDDWIMGEDEEENAPEGGVDLDEDLIGNDRVGSISATSVVPVDELDVVDDGGNDGDDGGDYGEGHNGEDYVGDDYVGDDYLGDAYGAYDINDEINEDEDEDIMGDVPNINMNDLI